MKLFRWIKALGAQAITKASFTHLFVNQGQVFCRMLPSDD